MTQKLTYQQRRLCEEHLPLAIAIAIKMLRANPYLDRDNAMSDARLGLVAASVKYDSTKSQFGTYAGYKIIGAIRDGARQQSLIGDAYRRMAGRITKARYAFAAREHRFPNDTEWAQEAKISVEQLLKYRQGVNTSQLLSLDSTVGDMSKTHDADVKLADMVADPQDPYEDIDNSGDWAVLDKLLDRLPGGERFVLAMYFWERMTLGDIGILLGVTQSRASQIKDRALERLRDWASVELQEQLI